MWFLQELPQELSDRWLAPPAEGDTPMKDAEAIATTANLEVSTYLYQPLLPFSLTCDNLSR